MLALRSLGFEITPKEFIDNYLITDASWTDISKYWGSPYETGASFPPGMVTAANAFFQAQGSSLRAVDATGTSFEELRSLAADGVPILIWTTTDGNPPVYSGESAGGYDWFINEHCMLMYDADDGYVYVSDPLNGLLTKETSAFGALYAECGSYALYFVDEE